MPKFIFAYHGGTAPNDPAEIEQVMAAWNAWYGAMGERVVDGGGPCGMSATVSAAGIADDGGSNPLSGFTIVQAESRDEACEMARGCPMVSTPVKNWPIWPK